MELVTQKKYFSEANKHYGQLMRFLDRTEKHYSQPKKARKILERILRKEEEREANVLTLPLHYQLSFLKNIMRISLAYKTTGEDIGALERIYQYSYRNNKLPNIPKLKSKIEEYRAEKGTLPPFGTILGKMIKECMPEKIKMTPEEREARETFRNWDSGNDKARRDKREKIWGIDLEGLAEDVSLIDREMSDELRYFR